MEAAGLVLGAVPIVVGVLKSYKTGKNLTDRVRNRKKHIGELILALQGYHAALTGYLEWLLKGADVWEGQVDNIGLLFKDQSVVEAVTAFVGLNSAEAFGNALEACQEAITDIARSIDQFLLPVSSGASASANVSVVIAKFGANKDISTWKGIKLAFSRSELDAQIQKIDSATSIIDKLQSIRTAIGQLDSNKPSRQCRRLANDLTNVGKHAERLYQAFVRGWTSSCHSKHSVKLYLEDRILDIAKPGKLGGVVKFNVIFAGEAVRASRVPVWHVQDVQVINQDSDYVRITTPNTPKVKIVAPSGPDTPDKTQYKELRNICISLAEAERLQKVVQLYLLSLPQLHYCYREDDSPGYLVQAGQKNTISLAELIATSSAIQRRSGKISLRSRLRLALILASATAQLSSTRWLRQPWAKANIHFLVPEASTSIVPASVDLTQPLISEVFDSKLTASAKKPSARQVLLELGIILLELWNETTLEEHYSETMYELRDDYYTRLSLAQRWLEESEGDVLPTYYDVVARCVKCHFDGIPVDPDWKEPSLQTGLIKTVVEPLQRQCRVDA